VVTAVNNDNILSPNNGRTAASGKREAEQPTTTGGSREAENSATQTPQQPEGSVDVARASQLYNQAELSSPADGDINSPQQAEKLAAEIGRQFREDAEVALRSQGGVASATLTALLENAPP
jgi:hypothetical protein